MNIAELEIKDLYNYCLSSYIELFEDKQDLIFTGWKDYKGGIAKFGRSHYSFNDIRHDIDTYQSKDEIKEWKLYGESTYKDWTDEIRD